MSVVEQTRRENDMPLSIETLKEIAGYHVETPREAAERDVKDILDRVEIDFATIVNSLAGALSR